jgi:2-methylcitrate dehydratase PrpD
MPHTTKELADFILDIRFESLESSCVEKTKMCVEDLIGVALCASSEKSVDIFFEYFKNDDAGSVCVNKAAVWKTGFHTAEYRNAAACNAALSHLLDLDDVHNASITHLGTVTIPAALALSQKLHKSGKEFIAAIAAGYEAGARIGEAINPSSYYHWHTTALVGPFCSAAAAGRLIGLSRTKMLHAFGSAGTQAGGLWEFLEDGAMSKALHTANGTLCGIRAAELARLGLTGASRILEGERGLIKAVAPVYRIEALTENFGNPYKIQTSSFKPYACCRHTHSAVFAVEKLLLEYQLKADEIVRITDRTYKTAVELTDNNAPVTPYAAKFSLQYCIAAMLLYGDLSKAAFTPEKLSNPGIRELINKIDIAVDAAVDAEHQKDANKWPHALTIQRTGKPNLEIRVDYPLGDFQNPFDWEMTDKKFRGTARDLSAGEQETLIEKIRNLEQIDDMNDLFDFGGELGR